MLPVMDRLLGGLGAPDKATNAVGFFSWRQRECHVCSQSRLSPWLSPFPSTPIPALLP